LRKVHYAYSYYGKRKVNNSHEKTDEKEVLSEVLPMRSCRLFKLKILSPVETMPDVTPLPQLALFTRIYAIIIPLWAMPEMA